MHKYNSTDELMIFYGHFGKEREKISDKIFQVLISVSVSRHHGPKKIAQRSIQYPGAHLNSISSKEMSQQERLLVKVKTSAFQVQARLPVINILQQDQILLEEDPSSLIFFQTLPQHLCDSALKTLKKLTEVDAECIDHEEIRRARLELQSWFQEKLHPTTDTTTATNIHPYEYWLRNIIPRRSANTTTDSNDKVTQQQQSTSFTIQTPVSRFHTDSTHTAFVNLWLPMAEVHNDHFSFLYHLPTKQMLTASLLEQHNENQKFLKRFLESDCCVLYASPMKDGHAWIFQSGGAHGILHGSIRFADDDREATNNKWEGYDIISCARQSVEFRCQPYDTVSDQWIYGEESNRIAASMIDSKRRKEVGR